MKRYGIIRPDAQKVNVQEPLPAVEVMMPSKTEYVEVEKVIRKRKIDTNSPVGQQIAFSDRCGNESIQIHLLSALSWD